jgi:hypothetical protein
MKASYTQYLENFSLNNKIILILLFICSTSYGQVKLCTAKLTVDHDLNVGSSNTEGAYYLMTLSNEGDSADTFTLSYDNINNECSNTDGSSTASNVNLKTLFVDKNLMPIHDISLNPGQSFSFYSHVTIPTGTNTKKWCCTQVSANSNNCVEYKAKTIIHTYYSGPNEN